MPQTNQTEKKAFPFDAAHYGRVFAPPITLPSREEMFDFQIETLVGKKLAKYADADAFRDRLNELPNDRFLFVPPPPTKLDLAELMAKIELNGKTGVNYLDVQYLKDTVEAPTTASLLVDVEDGGARLNTKPSVSRENIKREGRQIYTTWRGIVHLAVFPWVLTDHYMDLVGSQYNEGIVPLLYLNDDEPALSVRWEGNAVPKYGAPSAGSVIVP